MTPEERLEAAEQRICQLWSAVLWLQQQCPALRPKNVRIGSVRKVVVYNPMTRVGGAGLDLGLSSVPSFSHTLLIPGAPRIAFALSSIASFVGTRFALPAPQIKFALSSIATQLITVPGAPALEMGLSSGFSFAGAAPSYAGTAANDPASGTVAWSNPGNATGAPDGAVADAALTVGTMSTQLLTVTNYGASVPAGATIVGVKAIVTCRDASAPTLQTGFVQLYLGGVVVGTPKTIILWPSGGLGNVTYGGAADLWGAALAPADVNDPSFGVAIEYGGLIGGGGSAPEVDAVQLTIYYTL